MVVFVDTDVAFGRALELHARRGGDDLIDIEAAGLFGGQFPKVGPR